MRGAALLLPVLATSLACTTPSAGNTLAAARPRVERVRPEADLSNVRAEVWRSTEQAEAARALSEEPLSYPFARLILREQRPLFELVGLARPDYDPLELMIGPESERVAGFVVPAHGLILVRDPSNLGTMAHELGHIASYRLGYWDRPKPHLWLHPDREGDPAWIDLDAYIASWALEEGGAQLTELAALGPVRSGGVPPWTSLEENAILQFKGIDRRVKGPLVVRLQFLAYHDGLRFVLSRRGQRARVEEALDAAWQAFRWTTREIAFPDEEPFPSRLGPALEAGLPRIQPAPTGATRLGSLLLFQCLSNPSEFRVEPFDELARGLLDDLLLTWEGGRHLWLTRWADPRLAHDFVKAFGTIGRTATLSVEGNEVLVSWDAPDTNAMTVLRDELSGREAAEKNP